MNKKIIIIYIVLILIIALVMFLSSTQKIGPGTAYHFEVLEGCEVVYDNMYINLSTNRYGLTVNDYVLDNIKLRYGFGRTGYKESSFRESCQSEECIISSKSKILSFCEFHINSDLSKRITVAK